MICQKCNNKFSRRITIEGKVHHLSRRKFCLECSPFQKKNANNLDGYKWCNRCKQILDCKQFYRSTKSSGLTTYCKLCLKDQANTRLTNTKIKAVNLFGGKCKICGYNKSIAALDFHHLDPTKKTADFGVSRFRSWEKIAKELENCILLCSNCHREITYPECHRLDSNQ